MWGETARPIVPLPVFPLLRRPQRTESVNPIEDDAVETLVDDTINVGLWVAGDNLLPTQVPEVDVMAIGIVTKRCIDPARRTFAPVGLPIITVARRRANIDIGQD